jgi:tetratricopeptide (TPR) repeat protein
MLMVLAGASFFSCKTTAPSVVEKPAEMKPEQPGKFKYTPVAFAERLEELLAVNKYDEALAFFSVVPEPDASSASIRILKLSILMSARRTDEALVLANDIEAADPKNPDILYIQAMLAGMRSETKKRTEYLNRVIAAKPDHDQALTELGNDFMNQRNYPQAKTQYLKAIAAQPANSAALFGLARVYYMQEDLAKARDTLNLAIDKQPDYSLLWAERARVKSETKDLAGAIEDVKKAIEIEPDVYSHRVDLGNYYISSGNQQEARTAFTDAIRVDPNQYLAYIYRAGLNDDIGNTDEAISDYRKITELYPAYYFAAESLGVLLWGKGDYEGSGAAFEKALQKNPRNPSYALMMTLCYYRLGRDSDAKSFMGRFITTLDRNSNNYFLCRMFVDKSGDTEVLNRIMKETNLNTRNRMLFYSAMYYNLFQNKNIAQKYFIEITSQPTPSFFEFRLSQWALRDLGSEPPAPEDKAHS